MKTILFYWSKGAETRRSILRLIAACERTGKPCYINTLAEKLKLSHVAIKKHTDLMMDEKYIKIKNPGGKPAFLGLTQKGTEMADELSS
ncbi:Uncharacterised protein [uncultured archaeon]|nr:Uncharacterised protein [uncultured archaeon]